jgi:hypothetical protein
MIMVESAVVPTDKAQVVTLTVLLMLPGIQAGYTSMTNIAIPVAESLCQYISTFSTYRPTNAGNIQGERNSYCSPATITDDPTSPDLSG